MQTSAEDRPIQLVALGNGVWLDEIRREDREPVKDVPGGSVTFATLGARLFAANDPATIGMAFKAGHDFPESIIDIFRKWSIDLTVHRLRDKPSSRGLVFYEKANNNRKGFQRLTDPLPVTIGDLQGTRLLATESFEFFGTAGYIDEQVAAITSLCRDLGDRQTVANPFIVWEPHAKSCQPATLSEHQHAARLVDVFSPNHEELHSFFGEAAPAVDPIAIEGQAQSFVDAGIGLNGDGCIMVRAAGHGCLILSRHMPPCWLPPFHPADSERVVDATGAGNAFLGAFTIGWQRTRSYVEAAGYGTVAASFALEQVGLPLRSGECNGEVWNGCRVEDRLAAYRQQMLGKTSEA
ncbi:hypothetical protein B0A55_08626 [Friedmanniomyces simplex]|uniref:Carbohydrate kinase PfkB domain-containing protein n=1 Tax=Friedmanniomyces simplex TaxID=329884 RepID=A0A4U0WWN0_9PEZI|nr:hypothetical protein B0A55_08626 [Friedmanniomyces simplex]